MPWWMMQLYLFALNGQNIQDFIICVNPDSGIYVEKIDWTTYVKSETAFYTVQEFIDCYLKYYGS